SGWSRVVCLFLLCSRLRPGSTAFPCKTLFLSRVSQEIAVQQAITQAKGEIAQVIRRLQQGTANAQDAQQATANLNQIAQKYEPTPPPKSKPGFMPKL
ncbi:MAG: hypothetical protein AN485_23870, partial [Anabaena sp. MDT14b]